MSTEEVLLYMLVCINKGGVQVGENLLQIDRKMLAIDPMGASSVTKDKPQIL